MRDGHPAGMKANERSQARFSRLGALKRRGEKNKRTDQKRKRVRRRRLAGLKPPDELRNEARPPPVIRHEALPQRRAVARRNRGHDGLGFLLNRIEEIVLEPLERLHPLHERAQSEEMLGIAAGFHELEKESVLPVQKA